MVKTSFTKKYLMTFLAYLHNNTCYIEWHQETKTATVNINQWESRETVYNLILHPGGGQAINNRRKNEKVKRPAPVFYNPATEL